MSALSFSRLAAVVFAIVALLQLARALAGWDLIVDGRTVPMMVSWIAVAVAGALAMLGFNARI